uniref:DUF3511 domain-containing protein n=1 Tax=Chenopodium quinoa TaxID=63459 RepID=A0A803M7M0_CHEQI
MVTSGRVHAAGSSELTAYPSQLTRPSRGSKKGKRWGKRLSNPEVKRKKRVIKYKVYAMEGKVKASFRKGLNWIKNRVSSFVHGT